MRRVLFFFIALLSMSICSAQLQITNEPNATALAQRLVGDGVSISNATFTGNLKMAGRFKNLGNNNVNIDSGIVLSTGRAVTVDFQDSLGMNGNGINPGNINPASTDWNLPGDSTLADAIGENVLDLHDACVLEFDFVPAGDTIRFNYVFSSEEYEPAFACGIYIDAFGFFISGPGITGQRNIALVPNTTLPVSILNVNNALDYNQGPPQCPLNPGYYIDNETNAHFTHWGHTVRLVAMSPVTPCNTYHLKLVISDVTDNVWDSGVFLEAKSLNSNIVTFTNNTQTDLNNNSYIVEGCLPGSFTIKRPTAASYPFTVNLLYAGTAVNGVDVQALPASATIPANDTMVTINLVPIIDNLPEGIEYLKVYATAGCGSLLPIDSTIIQVRDYDTLTIIPSDTFICKEGSIQLNASNAYNNFSWDAVPGLSSYTAINPVATPPADGTMYYCTASLGNCNARDSVFLRWRQLEFVSQQNIKCQGASSGQIIVSGGAEWTNAPVRYWINNQPLQASGTFNNLPTGSYTVHITEASGCEDSVDVTLIQSFPDLIITDTAVLAATCTSVSDGSITVTVSGGRPPYQYSVNGTSFQASNVFNVGANTFTVTVKDANNCTATLPGIVVPFINGITLSVSANPTICESLSTVLQAFTNAASVRWEAENVAQNNTLTSLTSFTPTADPITTTKYYVTATLGVCTLRDSITVNVNRAPIPVAGADAEVCFGGQVRLQGSGGVVYHWQPATYLSSISVSDPVVSEASTITYNLNVIDTNGCRSLRSDAILVKVLPPSKLFAGYDTSVAIKQQLQLFARDVNGIGFTEYSWSPTTGLNNPFIKNPVATLTNEFNELIVTARTPSNCIGKDTIKVNTYRGPEIYVANSFTPNGDGLNDFLKAFPVGIKQFAYFTVYNRFGEMVFTTNNENIGWAGTHKGMPQGFGTFVWIAKGIDFKGRVVERKGTTMILR